VFGTLKIVGSRFSVFNSLMTRFLSHSEEVRPSRELCCSTTSLICNVTRVVSSATLVSESVLGIVSRPNNLWSILSWYYLDT
jgi:hypothetical protein